MESAGPSPLDNRAANPVAVARSAVTRTGDLIAAAREASGLSQSEVARRGKTSQAHLSEYERGLRSNGPTVASLARLMAAMGDTLVIESDGQRTRQRDKLLGESAKLAAMLVARRKSKDFAGSCALVLAEISPLRQAAGDDVMRELMLLGMTLGLRMGLDLSNHATRMAVKDVPSGRQSTSQ